ncbi:hypothetical protein DFJ73DRAFT_59567 [Zopfochytrium polystomum]|nr:hypothetical protein DFJ73DRAFT_59567 [Zopfochytrium polystomum]
MAAKRVDAVLIVDYEGQLTGILTDKDVAFRVVAEELDPRTTTLAEVMTPNPISVTSTSLATDALNRVSLFVTTGVWSSDEFRSLFPIQPPIRFSPSPDPTLDARTAQMVAGHFRHLPVTEDDDDEDGGDADDEGAGGGGGVVGVLDITKCLYDALEKLDKAYEASRKTIDAVIEAGSSAAAAAAAAVGGGRSGSGTGIPGSALAIAKYAEKLKRQLTGPDLGGLLSEQNSAPAVVSVQDSVLEAVKRMRSSKETATLVFDESAIDGDDGLGDLAGIFTSKDLVLRVVAAGMDPATTPVMRVMTPHPDCVTPDTQMLDALRKMHARKYLHLPVVGTNGVVEGLVDVLKLTYATLSQLRSMHFEESDGPMWTKFWDTTLEVGGSEVGSEARLSASGRDLPSNFSRDPYSAGGFSNNDRSVSCSIESLDDHTVFPEDSASRVTGGANSPDPTPNVGAGVAGSALGSAIPTVFTFKVKDYDSGKVLRVQSPTNSLAALTAAVVAKLGLSHPRVAVLGKDEALLLSYIDDEGDFVHLESDTDVRESVEMARAVGWARVMLSIDSQRQMVLTGRSSRTATGESAGGSIAGNTTARFSLASIGLMGASEESLDDSRALASDGAVSPSLTLVAVQSRTDSNGGRTGRGKGEPSKFGSLLAPVVIGSLVALVCAFLLGRRSLR